MPPERDVIVLDLSMDGMDGASFLTFLRRDPHHADIAVAVLTAKRLSARERAELLADQQLALVEGKKAHELLRSALLKALLVATHRHEFAARS